jgi:hypothetical protein
VTRPQFRSLFCEKFNCPPSEFERRAFKKCLYWHARWLGPVIRLFEPEFFRTDLQFIRSLGDSTGLREALEDRGSFHHSNTSNRSFLRTICKIRVSGPKTTRLAETLFSEPRKTVSTEA